MKDRQAKKLSRIHKNDIIHTRKDSAINNAIIIMPEIHTHYPFVHKSIDLAIEMLNELSSILEAEPYFQKARETIQSDNEKKHHITEG